jgi:hypothetical protein
MNQIKRTTKVRPRQSASISGAYCPAPTRKHPTLTQSTGWIFATRTHAWKDQVWKIFTFHPTPENDPTGYWTRLFEKVWRQDRLPAVRAATRRR